MNTKINVDNIAGFVKEFFDKTCLTPKTAVMQIHISLERHSINPS